MSSAEPEDPTDLFGDEEGEDLFGDEERERSLNDGELDSGDDEERTDRAPRHADESQQVEQGYRDARLMDASFARHLIKRASLYPCSTCWLSSACLGALSVR